MTTTDTTLPSEPFPDSPPWGVAPSAPGSSTATIVQALRAAPALLDVRPTAKILGVSSAGLYASIKRGDAPIRCIHVGGRIKVLTASLIELFEQAGSAEALRSA
jgi:hypothetical protein